MEGFLTDMEIVDNILSLLFAGHDNSRSAITLLVKYSGQMPQVFETVTKGQSAHTFNCSYPAGTFSYFKMQILMLYLNNIVFL